VIISKILSKLLPLVLKEVTKKLSGVKNDLAPLKKYVEEPNENNIAIEKMRDEFIFMKNKIKQLDSKANRKKDRKWYDE
jgi:hypothetical protein|tara:strand:+ start:1113 stop:1349 length:237 start_codon:yes stop_codon:yes gene_type:complete